MSDASTTTEPSAEEVVAATEAKVRDYLSTFEDVDTEDDGSCSLQYGSARVYVTTGTFDEDQSIVRVKAQCVSGAKASPELFRHVATFQADVGHLTVTEEGDGTACIFFSHSLMGEFLNPAELRMTVVAVAYEADRLDDGLAEQFGGVVYDADSNSA
jgi:hypothetical protein